MPEASQFLMGDRVFDLTRRTYVMGVLNVTPDSFSDGGLHFQKDDALRHAAQMIEDGVDVIDIGGESSRPAGPYGEGAQNVEEQEEQRRTAPVIEAIRQRFDVPVSIDTVKPSVARAAVDAGASAINDISGFREDAMVEVAAETGASVFVMHMKGTPQTMQRSPSYDDLIGEVTGSLTSAVERLASSGVDRERISVDPGLGFGKSYEDNYEIIRNLDAFVQTGCPVLIGPSRKTFIGLDYSLPPNDREEGSLAAVALCAAAGAHMIRVHNVRAARRALFVADRLRFGDKDTSS